MKTFTCADCKQTLPVQTNGGTGYATIADGSKVCYACCGERNKKDMIETGKATLYLSAVRCSYALPNQKWNTLLARVSNWPSTLEFKVSANKAGRHNMAGTRYDVWFTGPDGREWHGVTYGDNTQICHCRRNKDGRR